MNKLLALAAVLILSSPAFPHDIYTGLHGKNAQLCCGGDDCAATVYRQEAERYWFLTREQMWIEIPVGRITFLPVPGDEHVAEEDDHHAHLCYRSATESDRNGPNSVNVFGPIFLYCAFIPPSGT